MSTFKPQRDAIKILKDLEHLFERDRISNEQTLDQVRFRLRIPRGLASFGAEAGEMRFDLVVPYAVSEGPGYFVSPARESGFGRLSSFYTGRSEGGKASMPKKRMSKKTAQELTRIFIHNRPGLEEAKLRITKVEPRIYETDQAALKGAPLNAFFSEGRLWPIQPYVGYARMVEVEALNGLQRYIREELERGYSHPARG